MKLFLTLLVSQLAWAKAPCEDFNGEFKQQWSGGSYRQLRHSHCGEISVRRHPAAKTHWFQLTGKETPFHPKNDRYFYKAMRRGNELLIFTNMVPVPGFFNVHQHALEVFRLAKDGLLVRTCHLSPSEYRRNDTSCKKYKGKTRKLKRKVS